jgi:hypothetical protein
VRRGVKTGALLLFLLTVLCAGIPVLSQEVSASTRIVPSQSSLPDAPEAQVQIDAAPMVQDAATTGSVHGTVVDRDGSVYEGAMIELTQAGVSAKKATSDSNGHFQFTGVAAGAFQLTVSASGFGTQTVSGLVHAGENYEMKPMVLDVTSTTDVRVTASQVEIAQEQLRQEETQRVLGVIPNFYVVYDPNPAPLTAKQKYSLALRSVIDPVSFLGVGFQAGIEQATNAFSGYGQGAQGFAKRYGAGYADAVTNTMIGGAVLASWWKQDPRYYYKGTGTIRSRALYAIAMAVMCKGDNGHWQVAYSGIAGGLAAGGISNLYYPEADQSGAGLTFENLAIGTGESAIQNLIQEFVIRRLTPHVPKFGSQQP